jgi:NitT/TauT family transport system permease protein
MRSVRAGKKIWEAAFVSFFWLFVWIVLAKIVNKELLLPYPWTVLKKLGELCITLDFWKNVVFSLLRIVIGIVLGVISGTLLAILTFRFSIIYHLISPFMVVIRATPVASFIILALIWLGSGKLPIFICLLMVLPLVWVSISDGLRALDPKLAEVCKIFQLPFGKRFKCFYFPAILPYFISACRNSIGMAWKAGVAAEVLTVTPISIGKQLYNSKLYLETSELFAWTVIVVILSLIIEKLVVRLIGRLDKRRDHAKD